jgi:hypothetical protein
MRRRFYLTSFPKAGNLIAGGQMTQITGSNGGPLSWGGTPNEKSVVLGKLRMARLLAKMGKKSGYEQELLALGHKIKVATKRNGRRRRKPAGRIMMRCRRRKTN